MITGNVDYEDAWAMADPIGLVVPVEGLGQVGTGTGGAPGARGTYGATNPQKPVSGWQNLLNIAQVGTQAYLQSQGVGVPPPRRMPQKKQKKPFPTGLLIGGAVLAGAAWFMLRK
jgi:hypothetical protein